MKKIIAAFDGLKYSTSTQEYAIQAALKSDSFLVGVFLEDFTYHSYKLFDMVGSQGVSPEKIKELMEKDKQTRADSVQRFKEACDATKVRYHVHHDKSIALQELIQETIYGDLLVISMEETLSHTLENPPTRFIRDVLIDVQCPVLMIPEAYQEIKKVAILYNGDPSAVFAAKMFSYMLPWLKTVATEIVTVAEDEATLPNRHLIKEFITCHFPEATFQLLQGDPDSVIVDYLESDHDNTLIVLGAYRRSMMSRLFKPSMADALMKIKKHPLFIAHYK